MNNKKLIVGVIGSSKKENEHRVPIHPAHVNRIPKHLRERIFIEKGYGKLFHISDNELKKVFAGVKSREELFEKCDIILLAKPTEEDFPFFRNGLILWGWQHSVQGESITQVGIDKKLTYIAWEAMFNWKNSCKGLHVFHMNNEMAGYCSVLHALQLVGTTGHYGTSKKVAVISFGSVGRGAVHAIKGMGFTDITLFTQRPAYAVQAPIPSMKHYQFERVEEGSPNTVVIMGDGTKIPMAQELSKYDISINAVLQNPNNPMSFINNSEISMLKQGSLIIDVSCDAGIGFDFAKPTSFSHPTFMVGNNITYYGVDHTPTYLWNSSSYEISSALIPFLETVMNGPDAWDNNSTIRNAIEFRDGNILNQDILRFQNRSKTYPYHKLSDSKTYGKTI